MPSLKVTWEMLDITECIANTSECYALRAVRFANKEYYRKEVNEKALINIAIFLNIQRQ